MALACGLVAPAVVSLTGVQPASANSTSGCLLGPACGGLLGGVVGGHILPGTFRTRYVTRYAGLDLGNLALISGGMNLFDNHNGTGSVQWDTPTTESNTDFGTVTKTATSVTFIGSRTYVSLAISGLNVVGGHFIAAPGSSTTT